MDSLVNSEIEQKLDDDCEIVFFFNKQQISYNMTIDMIEKQVNERLVQNPKDINLLLINCQIKYKFQNDQDKALEILRNILIQDPLNIDCRLEIVNLMISKKIINVLQIEKLLQECIELDPYYWRVTFIRGMYYQLIDYLKKATKILDEGNKQFQNNAWIKTLLAQVYCNSKNEVCEKLLQEAIQIKKFNYEILTGISIIYLNQNKFERAQFYLDKVLSINKNSSPACSLYALLYKHYLFNKDKFLEYLFKALQLNKNNKLALSTLFQYYLYTGDKQNSQIYLKKLSELQINYESFYEKLCKIYNHVGLDVKKSKYYYYKTIRLNPKNYEANLIYLKQNNFSDYEEAQQASINFFNQFQQKNMIGFDDNNVQNQDYVLINDISNQFL